MTNRLPMTKQRWVILGTGLPVVLAVLVVTGWFWVHGAVKALVNANQVGYPVSLTAPLTGGQARLTTANSNLVLAAGQGRTIRVHGYLSGAMTRPAFTHKQTPAGLNLAPQCRAPVGNCSLGFTVTVPADVPVKASGSFGNLRAGSLRGGVTLSDTSGDILASRLAGHLRLADSFGNIQASGLAGSTVLSDDSGNIGVAGLTGDAQLSDGFGNITVGGLASADVRCQDHSGDIMLTFTKVPRRVEVSDSFGNVTLRLPPGPARYEVSTRNPYGSTSVTVPQSSPAAHVITVTDNSGDINVTN
jgi:Putative adhesin